MRLINLISYRNFDFSIACRFDVVGSTEIQIILTTCLGSGELKTVNISVKNGFFTLKVPGVQLSCLKHILRELFDTER